ncbi:hypothetical protein EDM56_02105 [Brevibacillus fluminis]|uniref:Uncharacterized protein n=1 Tax=Brevibacillus fluminis TaxID=511487 RepID=A0A3M8DWF8_9BACL|nr:P-loop NTPase fold protein [Brevibacillus fluminis]RNB92510.1 hypothetical protein EDM56_02105 [Brevibacillus fluminis]
MNILLETFKRYMNTPKIGYALHLDGPWGSGKTYFVKNELQKVLKKDYQDFKLIYVSLNGIKEVNEIGENVFLQILSPTASKGYVVARGTVNLFKNLIPFGNPSDMDFSNIDTKIQEFISSKNLDKVLLCFDDLERIDDSLSIESLLGYINSNFIEHNHVKTLLISNSEEMEEKAEFTRLKEKVIGRSITFSIKNEQVIYEILKNDYSNLYSFFEKNKEVMIPIFTSIDKLNLRTIKFVCDIFNEVFESLKENEVFKSLKEEELSDEALINIFTCALVVGIEYKKGTIKDLEEAGNKLNPYNLYFKSRPNDQEKAESILLIGTFVISRHYAYFDSIAEFIITGHFNLGKLVQEVKDKYNKESEEETSRNIVESYYDYELEEIKTCTEIVISAIKNGHYSPQRYPYLYTVLKEMVDKGYVEIGNLFDIVHNGLLYSLEINLKDVSPDIERALERFFSGNKDQDCNRLIQMIKEKMQKLREDETISNVELFVNALDNRDYSNLSQLANTFRSSANLFEHLCKISFAKRLLIMGNKSIGLFNSILNEMYLRIINASDFHHSEIPFIKELKDSLLQQLDSRDLDRLKKDLLNEVIKQLDKVTEHVNNKKEA